MGIEVHRPRVPAVGSVVVRAEKLAAAVRALPARKVNLIAHSMGGLDARYAICQLGLADRVASLTTIGTPHLGTPLADLGTSVLRRFRLLFRGLVDLEAAMNPLLWASHLYLSECAGANDGIVPASSQRWGDVVREIEADHWAQVGWSSSFDAPTLYEELALELRGRGF